MTTTTDLTVAVSTCADGCSCCAAPVNRSLLAPANERSLRRWAWALTALTIGWNSLEAVIAIVSGVIAGSIALVGFGLDSVLEVSSALIITWRLLQQTTDHLANERAERRAVRLIAVCFIGIALYVTFDAILKLLGRWGTSGAQPGRHHAGGALAHRHADPGVGEATRR